MADFRVQLEKLHPNVSLSVELPHNGNGNLFQVRTTLSDGLIFYGRSELEEEAVFKCCQKAVKHLQKNHEINYMHNASASNNSNQHQTTRKRQPPHSELKFRKKSVFVGCKTHFLTFSKVQKKTFFAISKMGKNPFLHQKKV